MDSSVSAKNEIWFLGVCHHVSNALYSSGAALLLVRLARPTGLTPALSVTTPPIFVCEPIRHEQSTYQLHKPGEMPISVAVHCDQAFKSHLVQGCKHSLSCDCVPLMMIMMMITFWRSYAVPTSREGKGGRPVRTTCARLPCAFVYLDSTITCRLHKLPLSDQTQVTLHLRVSLSDLV